MILKNGVRVIAVTGALVCAMPALAGVTFHNIAAGGGAGLTYGRTPSARKATLDAIQADGILNLLAGEYEMLPVKNYGGPGIAVLDYDKDGDLDIYVTNGPGTPNSLFQNRLKETGHLSFQDVAQSAGAALTSQDSNGVCFGDIENDGDLDLYVTGYKGNRLLKNNGNGTFSDITASSGTGGQTTTSVSCAMGDINGDGLLDVLVANTFDFGNNLAYAGTLSYFQYNQLLVNQGNRVFADQTAASGLNNPLGIPQAGATLATWAVSLIDIDMDGDLDAMVANDDHGNYSGIDAGFIRLFRNDGTGHFTDETVPAGLNRVGEWHGIAFGDLNCDGQLDIFGTNIGDYIFNPGFFLPGAHASRWLLGASGGTFTDPGVGDLVTAPTGWGAAMADYDNDGDSDIIYNGGYEFSIYWDESNPGVVLNNQGCSASFTWDSAALAGTNHLDRNVEGLATGDFNNDGFVDVVTVSSFDVDPGQFRVPLPSAPVGSIFDPTATMYFISTPGVPDFFLFEWQGFTRSNGSLVVEINSGNGNRWAAFDLVGTRGLVDDPFATGQVNRDGIGAFVRFTPQGGQPTLTPVLGGSSYASQNSLTVEAGMGNAASGTVEVIWPGGVKNRLYDVLPSERLTLPEIPCSFDAAVSRHEYEKCVKESLKDLRHPHVDLLTHQEADRLEDSALRAYDESH
jgi:enediyne biosynthesis protein E4